MGAESAYWRRCSSCKASIGFAAAYWVCNVSTCNRKRTGLVFCSSSCWDAHLPLMRHRESWAVEKQAPSREQWQREQAAAAGTPRATPPSRSRPARTAAAKPASATPPTAPGAASRRPPDAIPREILIVASRLKDYVRARTGFHTSDAVLDVLSDRVRALCDHAMRRAERAGRKTVLERDFE